MYGKDILCGISKVPFEIPHKISYPCIERYERAPRFKSSYMFLKRPPVSGKTSSSVNMRNFHTEKMVTRLSFLYNLNFHIDRNRVFLLNMASGVSLLIAPTTTSLFLRSDLSRKWGGHPSGRYQNYPGTLPFIQVAATHLLWFQYKDAVSST